VANQQDVRVRQLQFLHPPDFSDSSVAMLGELQLVEKKINGGNPAVPGLVARWLVIA
jgi:hypothetical protein